MDSTNGFSCSARFDSFPAGLRVLVVDDDPTWLKILEKMLRKCNYDVTTCNLAREALHLLRERKGGYDIVISDVNMPDMDGFKLLEHVGLEMDLPVIMMSVDGETSRVMKGVQHGACDYLLKPIRMKELRNIWQHVFRKRIHEVRDIEGLASFEEIHMLGNGTEQSDDYYLFSGDMVSLKKRKDTDGKHDDNASSLKKSRVVWTADLHQKFVKAVNQIGFDKVGPKKILDLMGVSWLTRENVASHLQKYRLYLSRLPKENELKSEFGGIKQSDTSMKDPFISICVPNSQIGTSENYRSHAPAHKVPVKKDDSLISGVIVKSVFPMPVTESNKSHQFGDVIDPPRSSSSRISFGQFYGSVDPGVPFTQFEQEQKPHLSSSSHINNVTKVESTSALFSVHPESYAFEQIPCANNQGMVQNLFDDSSQKTFTFGTGPPFKLWDNESICLSSQDEFQSPNIDFGSIDSFGHVNHDLIADIPSHLYDPLNFEYPIDPVKYHAIEQGLYIV